MPLTIPNLLTSFRIVAIPLVVLIYYLPTDWAGQAAGLLFGLAAVTDWFDGFLARMLDQTSRFGEFLDPIADKLLVSTSLILLLQNDPSSTWLGRGSSSGRRDRFALRNGVAARIECASRWNLFRQVEDTLQMFGRLHAVSAAVLRYPGLPHRQVCWPRGRADPLVDGGDLKAPGRPSPATNNPNCLPRRRRPERISGVYSMLYGAPDAG